jgi:putative ABC transport system substrate-binding protein
MNYARAALAAMLAFGILVAPLAAEAQKPGKPHRIGFLRTSAPPDAYIEAFRQGLKELGYIEGKNIAFEYRWAGGKDDQLPALAAELVSLTVDIISPDMASLDRALRPRGHAPFQGPGAEIGHRLI